MSGRIDYHVHTSFSDDGCNSPEEMVRAALELGYSTLCLTDHVRRDTAWIPEMAAEVGRLKKFYAGQIEILAGLEAKVLDTEGGIDLPPGVESIVDLVLASFHGIPGADDCEPPEKLDIWFHSFLAVLDNPVVHIIAHPTAYLKMIGLEPTIHHMRAIAAQAAQTGKSLEINSRYGVPDPEFRRILESAGVELLPGSDSHSVEDLKNV